jgi:hypothetical protein
MQPQQEKLAATGSVAGHWLGTTPPSIFHERCSASICVNVRVHEYHGLYPHVTRAGKGIGDARFGETADETESRKVLELDSEHWTEQSSADSTRAE